MTQLYVSQGGNNSKSYRTGGNLLGVAILIISIPFLLFAIILSKGKGHQYWQVTIQCLTVKRLNTIKVLCASLWGKIMVLASV